MDQSYLIDMLERVFLLQQKRVWSLETLRKLDNGVLFPDAPESYRQQLRQDLESNLRIARETINDLARDFGFEAGPDRLFDPTFVLGMSFPKSRKLDQLTDKLESTEIDQGIFNYRALCRELAVKHHAYLEDVQQKVIDDVAFYRACQDMVGASSNSESAGDAQRQDQNS